MHSTLEESCSEQRLAKLASEPRWIEDEISIMRSPIALVGNGPLRRGSGRIIDSHETVIRMNNCRIAAFEDLCGVKTTHWATNGNLVFSHANETFRQRWVRRIGRLAARSPNTKVHGELVRPEFGPEIPTLVPIPYSPLKAAAIREHYGREPIFIRDSRYNLIIRELSPRSTTGFAMACLLIALQKDISAFGFNGLADGHYWAPKHMHWSKHMPDAQREMRLIAGCPRIKLWA